MPGRWCHATDISYETLRETIVEIKQELSNFGIRMILGALAGRGIVVPRSQVVSILHEIDPIGTARRWAMCIHRRQYSVPGSMFLWHNDTNHKV